jgi:hypothetical protein
LDRARVRELQGLKLHRYLRDCVLPFSKHYQAVFAQAGLTADDIRTVDDLAKIPFTRKEELLPTPEQPRKSLEFVLVPDPAVLRKRPSTSELIDWLAALKSAGISSVKLDEQLPFIGALLKREQDLMAFADQFGGKMPKRA